MIKKELLDVAAGLEKQFAMVFSENKSQLVTFIKTTIRPESCVRD